MGASVVTQAMDPVLDLYHEAGFREVTAVPAWGRLPPPLERACTARAWLSGGSGRPWLQLIEIPTAISVDRYRHAGWFSLEVGTNDVDALAERLSRCNGFEILAGPAPLEVSEDIVAAQVIGPASELYYFTQVKRPMPPFELPTPQHQLDELFIAVTTTADRDATLNFWEALSSALGMRFETRIGVLNRGLGLPESHRLPVAIAQLAGANLIEIDQIQATDNRPTLTTGIAMISVAATRSKHLQGVAGEWVELVADQSEPRPQPR